MHTQVAVIVSKCVWDRHAECWRVWERVSEETYPTLDEAVAVGESKRAEKLSVLIRPTYNEEDVQGRFFREWRSFNGEHFKEVRWPL